MSPASSRPEAPLDVAHTSPGGGEPPSPHAESRRITIAVSTYNGSTVIRDCLAAVQQLQGVEYDLVVIDNASTDGTPALVRQHFPTAHVLERGANGGPNAARNAALAHGSNRWVLLVDDDVMLERDTVVQLLDGLAARPDAAIISGLTLYHDRPDTVQYGFAWPHFMGETVFLYGERRLSECPPALHPVVMCVGTFMLVDRDKAAFIGGFDEHYFFGKDDTDFSVRMTQAGFDIVEVPTAVVYHRVKPRGFRLVERMVRNRWYFMVKLYSLRTWMLITPLLVVDELLRIGFLAANGRLKDWYRGTFAAIRDLPLALRARRRTQALRRRPDSEILIAGTMVMRTDILRPLVVARLKRVYDAVATGYWNVVKRFA